ncbi:hypothetical protein HYT05_02145 [Candidatus Kaiserbacteria bacterium]|nr:hypothetical protein [Candidatus Kaiserbacteria bacterium]
MLFEIKADKNGRMELFPERYRTAMLFLADLYEVLFRTSANGDFLGHFSRPLCVTLSEERREDQHVAVFEWRWSVRVHVHSFSVEKHFGGRHDISDLETPEARKQAAEVFLRRLEGVCDELARDEIESIKNIDPVIRSIDWGPQEETE